MTKRLSRFFAIVLLQSLLSLTTPHTAQAITHTATNQAYFTYIQKLIISKLVSTPTPKILGTKTKMNPTPTLYIQPSITPTPIITQKIQKSTPTMSPSKTADFSIAIMNEINVYRASQGLSAAKTSFETCQFAQQRAKEISENFDHSGFDNRMKNKTLPYTSWTQVTENIAMSPSYKQVVTIWKNSPGHAANMRANTPFICVRSVGNYYAFEGLRL